MNNQPITRGRSLPKVSLGSFVFGILVAVVVYHGYVVYTMRTAVITAVNQSQINDQRLTQIETLLNQILGQGQQAQQGQAAQAAAPAAAEEEEDN